MSLEPIQHYVDSRQIGDVTVTTINDATWLWDPQFPVPEEEWRRALPDADAAGQLTIGLNIAHIETGDASILIDLGFEYPSLTHQPERPGLCRTPGIVAGLAEIGIEPEGITHVLITHSHSDHLMGAVVEPEGQLAPRFPRARYLMGRAEWECGSVG